MPTDENQAESKALSVDDAVALLDQQQQTSQPGALDDGESTETSAGAEDAAGEAAADAQTGPEQAEAPVEAPSGWDEQAKTRFAELPADIQALIVSRESEHKKAVSSARADVEQAKANIDQRVSAEIGTLKALLDRLVPDAAKTFRSRWADIDWTTLPEKVGTDEAFKLKAQFEKERDQMRELEAAQKTADDKAYTDFVRSESGKLKQVAPDLVDAEKGQGRREALGKFLVSNGYSADQIRFMTAHDASIAYDAMRWRDAEAKARSLAKAKPAAKPSAPKPSALPAVTRPSPAKKTDDAFRRLSKTGRIDDAVAYLNARNK